MPEAPADFRKQRIFAGFLHHLREQMQNGLPECWVMEVEVEVSDGVKQGDQVTVYTRSLDDVTARLPEVVEATLALPVRELIADGEAIALRPDGRPQPFQVTASRFGRSVEVAAARTAQPLSVFFFDILHRDGIDLLDAPTSERTAALDDIVPVQNRVDRLITSDPAAAGDFLDTTLAAGHEGVMAKSLTAPYEAGRRGAGWPSSSRYGK